MRSQTIEMKSISRYANNLWHATNPQTCMYVYLIRIPSTCETDFLATSRHIAVLIHLTCSFILAQIWATIYFFGIDLL